MSNSGTASYRAVPKEASGFETDGSGTIMKYVGKAKAVVIPAHLNGKPVISIGDYAFYRNQLTSVTIPDTVTFIETFAFSGNELTSVTIPSNVNIGHEAIPYDFNDRYKRNGKKAGTYLYSGGVWSVKK